MLWGPQSRQGSGAKEKAYPCPPTVFLQGLRGLSRLVPRPHYFSYGFHREPLAPSVSALSRGWRCNREANTKPQPCGADVLVK